MANINMKLDDKKKRELKMKCVKNNISITAAIEKLIDDWLGKKQANE